METQVKPESSQMEQVTPFRSSATITQLVAALAKAQGEFPRIPKNKEVRVKTKTGGVYTFSYAPLETIMDAVRPVLAKNGLAVVQLVDDKAVSTLLMHTSGEWFLSPPIQIRVSDENANSSQAFGSGVTYAKRYSLTATLGVVADDDDDGNAADGNSAEVTKDGTPDGQRNAVSRALTGKSVAANLKEDVFLESLRAAAPLGATELKKIWNGGTLENRKSVPVKEWEDIKLLAVEADTKAGRTP